MGGRHVSRRRFFLVPNKPRTGVLVSLSHPLLTQASTQLYTFFGFRANPLNSHSPPSLDLRGPPGVQGPPGASGSQPPGTSGASGASGCLGFRMSRGLPSRIRMLGLVVGFASFLGCQPCSCLADPEISAFPGCLKGLASGPQSDAQKPRRSRSPVDY